MRQQPDMMALVVVIMAFVLLLILLIVVASFFLILFRPWLRGFLSGAPITIFQLIGMRLRGVPTGMVVDAVITLVHRGHPHTPRLARDVESTYLAQRGFIESSTQLADMVEKQLPKAAAAS
jgi:uncharacterized protein YqfA (UPF0365 family)